MLNVTDYKNTIIVTGVYLVLYYLTIINILRAKLKAAPNAQARVRKDTETQGKRPLSERMMDFDKYTRSDPAMIRAERTQMNMLEQMPPFLASFWIYSLFVDPVTGVYLGSAYTLFRALYWFLWPTMHYLVTISNYVIVAWFWVGIFRVAFA